MQYCKLEWIVTNLLGGLHSGCECLAGDARLVAVRQVITGVVALIIPSGYAGSYCTVLSRIDPSTALCVCEIVEHYLVKTTPKNTPAGASLA